MAQRRTLQILAKQVMTHLELRLAFRRLQSHTAKLLATNATKDRFFYIIAHDLRGPFYVMTGYAKMLVDRLDRPDLQDSKKMAEEIGESCTMTLKLLDNLLEWALCESGNIKFQPSAIDLEELERRQPAHQTRVPPPRRPRLPGLKFKQSVAAESLPPAAFSKSAGPPSPAANAPNPPEKQARHPQTQ